MWFRVSGFSLTCKNWSVSRRVHQELSFYQLSLLRQLIRTTRVLCMCSINVAFVLEYTLAMLLQYACAKRMTHAQNPNVHTHTRARTFRPGVHCASVCCA